MANGDFYTDGGAADAYVLTKIGTKQTAPAYTDGFKIRFIPANTNTGASTVNAAGLGVKNLKDTAGGDLVAGAVTATEIVLAYYDLGSDEFRLIPQLTNVNLVDLKSGRKNFLINGNFDIWQRNTSFTDPDGEYTADRWRADSFNSTGAATISRQAFTLGQTAVPNEPEFFYRHDQTTAIGVAVSLIEQRIEGVRTLAGQKVQYSFYAKVASGTKTLGTQFRQNFGTGGSPSSDVATVGSNIVVTTTFQRFTIEFDVPSITGKTLGSNDNDFASVQIREESSFSTFTLDVAQAQVEAGSIATDFEIRPISEELVLAKRYFEAIVTVSALSSLASGSWGTSVFLIVTLPYSEKRDIPSISFSTASDFSAVEEGVTTFVATAISASAPTVKSSRVNATAVATVADGHGGRLLAQTTNAKISIDSEL